MIQLTQQQIKEIPEELDSGLRCFIHKENGEILTFPDTFKNIGIDTEPWEEEMEKLDDNFLDYYEIDQMESYDSFQIMEGFTESLSDSNHLKNKLIAALNRKKPFREFKFVIENSGEYRKMWFDYKNQKLIEWVNDSIERFNNSEA